MLIKSIFKYKSWKVALFRLSLRFSQATMQFSYIIALFVVLAVVSAAPTEEQKAARKKAHDDCQADSATHVDEAVFEKLKQGEEVHDPKLHKHSLCMNVKLGIQSENGDINLDKLRHILEEKNDDKDKATEIITKCGTRGSGTAEDVAVALMKCLHENGHHGHHHH